MYAHIMEVVSLLSLVLVCLRASRGNHHNKLNEPFCATKETNVLFL